MDLIELFNQTTHAALVDVRHVSGAFEAAAHVPLVVLASFVAHATSFARLVDALASMAYAHGLVAAVNRAADYTVRVGHLTRLLVDRDATLCIDATFAELRTSATCAADEFAVKFLLVVLETCVVLGGLLLCILWIVPVAYAVCSCAVACVRACRAVDDDASRVVVRVECQSPAAAADTVVASTRCARELSFGAHALGRVSSASQLGSSPSVDVTLRVAEALPVDALAALVGTWVAFDARDDCPCAALSLAKPTDARALHVTSVRFA